MTLSKQDAVNNVGNLQTAILGWTVQFASTVYAARHFTGPARVVYTTLALIQSLGLLALAVAQGATLMVAKQKAEEERVAAIKRSTAFMN